MIEKNIYLVTIVRKKGNLSGIRVPNSTYTFVITKKPKSFRRWNSTPYLPAVEATLWLNFSSLIGAVLR